MRKGWIALASFVLVACAQADEASSSPDAAPDARKTDSIAAGDTGAPSDGSPADGLFPTEDTRDDDASTADTTPPDTAPIDTPPPDTTPPTCATPGGSTATASGAYSSAPGDAVDGDESTSWNAGDYTGWLDIVFPHAIYFDRIRIAATALPECIEPYTFTGYLAGASTPLGSASIDVPEGTDWVPTVPIPAGTYDELRIDVGSSASWIAIAEVVVYDSAAGCGLP